MLPKWLALGGGLVLALVGMGWQSWQLLGTHRGNFIDERSLRLQVASRPETGMGLEQIAGLHLFGNPAAKPAAPAMPKELPKTDLKLTLVGAITDSDPSRASALIDAEKQTRRYYIGENIPGGAVLHEVRADSVVLKRDNRYETLSFPKSTDAVAQARGGFGVAGGSASVAPAQPAAPVITARQETVPAPTAAAPSRPPQSSTAQQPQRAAGVGPVVNGRGLSLRERFQRQPRPPEQKPPTQNDDEQPAQ